MPPVLRCTATLPSVVCTRQLCQVGASSRSFSTSPRHEQRTTRARRGLFRWLQTNGTNFLNPREDSTNYLSAYNTLGQLKRVVAAAADNEREKVKEGPGASAENAGASKDSNSDGETKALEIPPESTRDLKPFPLNGAFISQPVLGGMVKEEIWFRIMVEGKSVREVSAELGVEMARVGAVVRLKEIEKEWERIGKPLAHSYQTAVSKMLPKTLLAAPGKRPNFHETINDLPVHRATGQQIWHPTSESRHFTRADAAKVFDDKLLPADARVPHPELTVMHKEFMEELTFEEQQERAAARDALAEKKRAVKAARQAKKEAAIKKVDTGRWEFHITDINVDAAGKTGRGHKGVGWRYGQPHDDRTRGKIKIPTSVE
ncbi:eukaryotic mitochondrial regulator protein-domain-containing protein [Leptodontidium sp. MPI-SDFR-AT-0119]|nr:eukaryotic mitochondrial regulator protein-domain-containing protein [Leptodontidium sp. MPI-SDFR-AT-0119]